MLNAQFGEPKTSCLNPRLLTLNKYCNDVKIGIQQVKLQTKVTNCTSIIIFFGSYTTTHRPPPQQLYHVLMNINKLLICNYLFILYFHYTQEYNTSALQCNLVNFDYIKCYFWTYIWVSSVWFNHTIIHMSTFNMHGPYTIIQTVYHASI